MSHLKNLLRSALPPHSLPSPNSWGTRPSSALHAGLQWLHFKPKIMQRSSQSQGFCSGRWLSGPLLPRLAPSVYLSGLRVNGPATSGVFPGFLWKVAIWQSHQHVTLSNALQSSCHIQTVIAIRAVRLVWSTTVLRISKSPRNDWKFSLFVLSLLPYTALS
jgi:hypothetical protein